MQNRKYFCSFILKITPDEIWSKGCQLKNVPTGQVTATYTKIYLSLIFKFDEEISEIIGNEKDETKLFFEKYQLSLTSNISAKTSSN